MPSPYSRIVLPEEPKQAAATAEEADPVESLGGIGTGQRVHAQQLRLVHGGGGDGELNGILLFIVSFASS